MHIFTKVFTLLCISLVTTQLHAATSPFDINRQLNGVNKETLLMLKSELEISRKVLTEIRDSANPGVISSATGALGTVIKELLYIVVATGLVIVPIGGVAMICSPLQDSINATLAKGGVMVAAPCAIVAVLISYTLLKLIFGKLLASSPNDLPKNIKDALVLIDQTLNKLDYEIAKIERVSQMIPA